MAIPNFARCRSLRHVFYLALLAPVLAPSFAQASVTVQVLATDPESPAVLGHWEELYLRIAYTSDQPIRVRGEAFYAGQKVTQMTSGSSLYEAGTGEAFFWLAFTRPQRVDTITVTAEDERTHQPSAQTSLSVDLTWTGETQTGERSTTPRVPADWVALLKADQDRRVKAAAAAYQNRPIEWWSTILAFAAAWSVPAYFVLQIVLLRKMRKGWRLAAAVPTPTIAAATSSPSC